MAGAETIMLFDIFNFGIFADEKSMHAIMHGVGRAAIIDTTTRNDCDVRIFADMKIIIDSFFEASNANSDWNMNGFILSMINYREGIMN